MHILCTICSDLVNPAENIYVTKCGHVFHHHCLSQWIDRSKSCPQCRNKVTEKCMFRFYPTISNELTGEDVATLQSRFDDAQLQLRQQITKCRETEEKLAAADLEVIKNMGLLKASEKKLESRDTAISAMKEQLCYLKIQNKETQTLKEENESLKTKLQTLNGLQKVLNGTSQEVEQMLQAYTDVKMVATFATALKRALCESENKKSETRDTMQRVKQKLTADNSRLQAQILVAEEKLSCLKRKYYNLKQKRKLDVVENTSEDSSPGLKKMKPSQEREENSTVPHNESVENLLNKIENADSPYLRLRQGSLALSSLTHPTKPMPDKNLKPSEYALLNSARNAINKKPVLTNCKTSIFQTKEPVSIQLSLEVNQNRSALDVSYDGLGGHSKLDTFPVPQKSPALKSRIPKLSAKHRLKRPDTASGLQNIQEFMFKDSRN